MSRVILCNGLIHKTWYYTQFQVNIIVICILYTFFWHYSDFINDLFWSFIQKKCGNICFYICFFTLCRLQKKCGNICLNILFLYVMSACFLPLIPCLKYKLHNVTAKTGNRPKLHLLRVVVRNQKTSSH